MRTIYLVRHGKPEFAGGEKRCIGRTDLPLSEEGKLQIQALSGQFERSDIERIYTSPLRRCVESAYILSGVLSQGQDLIPVEVVDGMEEIDMGVWENLTFAEIREAYPAGYEKRGLNMADFAPPGGESFSDCQKRALKVFETIRKSSRGNVILMGHAGFNRTLICSKEGKRLRDLLSIPQEYGSVYPWNDYIFDAMIVAAGLSSRMGDFKPLMELEGKTVIGRELDTLRAGGVGEIVVVTGRLARKLSSAIDGPDVRCIHNPDYENTKMFDSVRLGFSYFKKKLQTEQGKTLDGIFFLPVDVPLFSQFTMEYEKRCFTDGTAQVYCPTCCGEPGHPLLIRSSAISALLSHDGERGLKGAYEKLGQDVVCLDVPDQGILMDADTPEEFLCLQTYERGRNILDEAACFKLLSWFQTGEDTVRHCMAVADMAVEIGMACNRNGAGLDLNLIRSAALLHDIAKGRENHAKEGAKWLSLLGFEAVAEIVNTHMEMPEEQLGELNESLIVYLADKRVQGNKRVTLKERFADKRRRFSEDLGAMAGMERRYNSARRAEELVRRKGYQDEIN